MSDGIVVIGTVAIVGVVAVLIVALVYDRPIAINASEKQVQIDAVQQSSKEIIDDNGPDEVPR